MMDEQLKEIWKRKEQRNREIQKMCESLERPTIPSPIVNKESAKAPAILSPIINKESAKAPAIPSPIVNKEFAKAPAIPSPIVNKNKEPVKTPTIVNFNGQRNREIQKMCESLEKPVETPTIPHPIVNRKPIKMPTIPIPLIDEGSSVTSTSTLSTIPSSSVDEDEESDEITTIPNFNPVVDEHFRPITPTDQIIGSLWDDINKELEKLKEAKKSQIDPNLSPRSSRYGLSEPSHSISNYRLQNSIKRGVCTNLDTSKGSLNDMTPEKRQRSDSDSGTNENDKMDQPDSTTASTMITAEQHAKLKHLKDVIVVQQQQICQASRALSFCYSNEHFRGSKEEVDARRALLISTERRKALLSESERISQNRFESSANEPRGTLEFKSISVRLARDYVYNAVHNPNSTSRYNFIVLIKCGEQVFHTSLKTTEDGLKSGFIEFPHHIRISGIPPDFVCKLEVFSLKSLRDNDTASRSANSKKGTWRRMVISTPLNAYTNTFTSRSAGNANAQRPVGIIDSGFQLVAHVEIKRQLIAREKFVLKDPVYPLDGCCVLIMDCSPDQNSIQPCQHRSFLSLYQIVSGMGSWNRYWCVLGNGELNFWRYPEDEATKNPTAHLKLTWCISQVTAVPQSTASLPNSMQLDVMEPSRVEGEQKECIRMMFAADTPEEKDYWIQGINQAIKNTQLWRSTKRKITHSITEVK